jgi:hypothetical protein
MKSYRSFIEQLNSYIQKTRTFWQLKLDQQIAGEMRMLRRLAGEGVITQRDYDQAKGRLFGVSNKKSRQK